MAQLHFISDNRVLKMARPHISVFYDDHKHYDCPDCKVNMDRVNRHGWYWECPKCLHQFPLYMLKEPEPIPKSEGWAKKFLSKVREAL